MSAVLSKTTAVLHRDPLTDVGYYESVDEETGVLRRSASVDIQTFQDLGEPSTITVTIEPGDTLND